MYCQCVKEFGQPLDREERPDMVPTGSEVILQISASGVCHTDLHFKDGGFDLGGGAKLSYAERGVTLPIITGHEIAGNVVAIGPDAGPIETDKRYVVYPWSGCGICKTCQASNEHLCNTPQFLGIHRDGGYATHVRIAHPRYLFDAGDLAPEISAPLACSGLTTFAALKKISDSTQEQSPVLIGAGGLGLMCIQLAKAQNLKAPVVVDIDPQKRQAALDAGALAAIDPKAQDVVAQIQDACGGAPRAVIDFVGAEQTTALAMDVIAKGGTIVIVGLFGGATPWPIPMLPLKSVSILGSYTGSLNDFGELMALAREGRIIPIPTHVYPLDEADDVLNQLERGKVIGRAVLSGA